jgi:hypothetical protein
MRRAVGSVASAAMLLAACEAISGLDVEYRLEGAEPSPDDGGNEASVPDVVSTVAADANAADVDARPSWCPDAAVLCEDWDTRHAKWTRTQAVGGDSGVEDNVGIDGSKALHAQVVNTVGNSRAAVQWATIGEQGDAFPDGRSYALTFSFRLPNDGIDYAVLGAIQVNNTQPSMNTEYGVARYQNCSSANTLPCIDENNPPDEGLHSFETHFGYDAGWKNEWHRALVKVQRSGTKYLGTVEVDGVVLDSNGPTYFGTSGVPTVVEVGVGLFFTGTLPGTGDAYIDDIAVVAE